MEKKDEQTKVKINKREDNFSEWYLDVVSAADFADYAPVRGCMVIKPHGYALWERMQKILDKKFKETGHQNAYFPLLIPESYLKKEAEHVDGFSPELAVVTYAGGKKLEENLIIRPTSETIIYSSFAKWINSWRDLPLLINQWSNVVRWEMRTRFFLRTSEFLWQEGHTAHATHKEAEEEAQKMLVVYKEFVEDYLAVPVIDGYKSESEKFAGALNTLTIEALMQDKKALQCGTSHDLGQNFAKAFDIKFLDKEGNSKYVWQTSWGLSTRLIGAVIMVHGDDNGIILPPKITPIQIVIVPIWKNEEEKSEAIKVANKIRDDLSDFSVVIDDRDLRPAHRYYEWERKGIPLRIEIGPRDIKNKEVTLVRRDTVEKTVTPQKSIVKDVGILLDKIQKNLFDRAFAFQNKNTHEAKDKEEFSNIISKEGGFIKAHWCGSLDCETKIKEETKATIRCLGQEDHGKCIYCGKEKSKIAFFAKAY